MGTQPGPVHLSKDSGTQPRAPSLNQWLCTPTPTAYADAASEDTPEPTVASKGTVSHLTEGTHSIGRLCPAAYFPFPKSNNLTENSKTRF